jgi:hypothetical protein
MILTEEQREELHRAAQPLMAWVHENGDPHMKAIVTSVNTELLSGLATARRPMTEEEQQDESHYLAEIWKNATVKGREEFLRLMKL